MEAGSSGISHSGAQLGSSHNQQASEPVENESQKKEYEPQLDKGLVMEIAGSIGELVGDNGGNRIPGRKQRKADRRSIADHHGDSHGFAEGASKGQGNRAQNTRAGNGDEHFPGRVPTGGTEREGRMTLLAR